MIHPNASADQKSLLKEIYSKYTTLEKLDEKRSQLEFD
jgi:hypothetical protein